MTKYLFLLVLVLLGCTSVFGAVQNAKKRPTKCDTSALYIIFEKYYEGHPYRFANNWRDQAHWDMSNQRLVFGKLNNYQIDENIGKGKFSKVFKGIYLPKNEPIAVKLLVHNKDDKIMREVMILKELGDTPNFLPIRDMLREKSDDKKIRTALIFDLFPTKAYKDEFMALNKYQVKMFIYETLRTVEIAHSRGIMHRDLKPLNVLMSGERNQVRVIDWGHSDYYQYNREYSVRVASLHFKSPELLMNYTMYDYSMDIWAIGCMLGEMTFLKIHLFQTDRPADPAHVPDSNEAKMKSFKDHLDAIAKIVGTKKLVQFARKVKGFINEDAMDTVGNYPKMPWKSLVNSKNEHLVEESVFDILEKMLTVDFTRRITAKEALRHPYFEEVRRTLGY